MINLNPNTARRFGAVACLGEDAQRMANYIVACARVARRLGGTAEAYRVSAQKLDCHSRIPSFSLGLI